MTVRSTNTVMICVLYYPAYAQSAFAYTRYLLKKAKARKVVFVINGNLLADSDIDPELVASGRAEVIRHDNVGLEFGAYQRGLDHVRKEDFDSVIFYNDTIGRHDPFGSVYLLRFAEEIANGLGNKRAIGQIDSRERRVSIANISGNRWLRTNFLGIDRQALDLLDFRIFRPDISELVVGSPEMETFFHQDLDETLRNDLSTWLFGGDGLSWYGARPLTKDNCQKMALKARSILQEWFLSLRLDDYKVAIASPKLTMKERVLDRATVRLPWRLRPFL